MDSGIQKLCPLTSLPNLTMTTTVALANDYGVNLPVIASLSQHKVPCAQGRQEHAQWCSENCIPAIQSLLNSSGESPVGLDVAIMFPGSKVLSRINRQLLLGGEVHLAMSWVSPVSNTSQKALGTETRLNTGVAPSWEPSEEGYCSDTLQGLQGPGGMLCTRDSPGCPHSENRMIREFSQLPATEKV